MDSTAILATLGSLSLLTKYLVQAARRHWPTLDGTRVQVGAAVLGTLQAWAIDFRATEALLELAEIQANRLPAPALDYVITGLAIAAGGGFIAELAKGKGEIVVEVDGSGARR